MNYWTCVPISQSVTALILFSDYLQLRKDRFWSLDTWKQVLHDALEEGHIFRDELR